MEVSKPVVIGSDYQASPTEAFNGHIDEVRISKALLVSLQDSLLQQRI